MARAVVTSISQLLSLEASETVKPVVVVDQAALVEIRHAAFNFAMEAIFDEVVELEDLQLAMNDFDGPAQLLLTL